MVNTNSKYYECPHIEHSADVYTDVTKPKETRVVKLLLTSNSNSNEAFVA